MHVLIAPDKFKGSLTAAEVAAALGRSVREAGASVRELPLADGGDGSVDAAVAAGFTRETVRVARALGSAHDAAIAVGPDTVVVELAGTCGLQTLPPGVLAPLDASTLGFGQAIAAALPHRPRRLVLALGGSASTDGGLGLLSALGFSFFDADGADLSPSATALSVVERIVRRPLPLLDGVEIVIAGDVTNPLFGPEGAAHVYGLQKGADESAVSTLDSWLRRFVDVLSRNGFDDARRLAVTPGAGAAGGAGFAALLLGGTMVSGAEFFCDLLGFDAQVTDADLVITGEGCVDAQTEQGKLLSAVSRRSAPRPVIAVAGRNLLSHSNWGRAGFSHVYALSEMTDADTASDPELTRELLRKVGLVAVSHAELSL